MDTSFDRNDTALQMVDTALRSEATKRRNLGNERIAKALEAVASCGTEDLYDLRRLFSRIRDVEARVRSCAGGVEIALKAVPEAQRKDVLRSLMENLSI